MKSTLLRREAKSLVRLFDVKALDEEARTFTGLAAAYSLDQGGDIILPGAFKRTLKDWRGAKKRIVPLLDAHDRFSVRSVIGKMIEATEVDDGLEATFQVIEGNDGDEVFRRVKGGYVDGLSIGYEAVEIRQPSVDESRAGVWRYLKEVKLLEVSVVPFPMNADARIDLDSVKALLAKGDLSDIDRQELTEVQDQISALLSKGSDATPATLATDDPARLAIEAKVRGLTLRSLGVA
jgi:HK97 family phage prohead protease